MFYFILSFGFHLHYTWQTIYHDTTKARDYLHLIIVHYLHKSGLMQKADEG